MLPTRVFMAQETPGSSYGSLQINRLHHHILDCTRGLGEGNRLKKKSQKVSESVLLPSSLPGLREGERDLEHTPGLTGGSRLVVSVRVRQVPPPPLHPTLLHHAAQRPEVVQQSAEEVKKLPGKQLPFRLTHLLMVIFKSLCSTEHSTEKSSRMRHRTSRCSRILSFMRTGRRYWVLRAPSRLSANFSWSWLSTSGGGGMPTNCRPEVGVGWGVVDGVCAGR